MWVCTEACAISLRLRCVGWFIRQHRRHSIDSPVATDVARSVVCLRVYHTDVLYKKRLNWSRCAVWELTLWAQEPCIRCGSTSQRRGATSRRCGLLSNYFGLLLNVGLNTLYSGPVVLNFHFCSVVDPGQAVSPLCAFVWTIIFELRDLWPRYLFGMPV